MGEEFDIKNVDDLVEFPQEQAPQLPEGMPQEGLPPEGMQGIPQGIPQGLENQMPSNLTGGQPPIGG